MGGDMHSMNHSTLLGTSKIDEIKTKGKTCYMIGDSHLRNLHEIMRENSELNEKYNVKVSMKPGYEYERHFSFVCGNK